MERRMKKRILTLGVVLLIGVALTTCSNPIDILASITTEVKAATGKFLVVKGLSPNGTTDVNPGIQLRIEFDRPVNRDTIGESTAKVQKTDGTADATSFQVKWNWVSDTLLDVWADPYLSNATDYTLTLTTGVHGADGAELQNQYTWTFKTGTYPSGNIVINGTVVNGKMVGATYTNDAAGHVALYVDCNDVSYKYRTGYSPTDFTGWSTWTSLTNWQFTLPNFLLSPTSPSDGLQTVYVQTGTMDNRLSLVRSASIILDRQPPSLSVPAGPYYVKNSNRSTGVIPPFNATDAWSGVSKINVSSSSPAGVTINASNALNAPSDGTYTVWLTATDGAGNTSVPPVALTLVRDTLNAPRYNYDTYGLPYVLWNEKTPPSLTWNWISGGGGEVPAQFRWKGDLGSGEGPATFFTYSKDYKPDMTYILVVTERDNAGNSASTEMGLTPTSRSVAPPDGTKGVLVPRNFSPASTAKVLQWRAVKNASYYIVNLRGGPGENDYRVSQLSGDPFLSVGLGPEYEYSWRIVTYDIDDNPIAESPTYYFTTIPIKS